jgi:hypothetical protein
MATPITPRDMSTEVILSNISVNYNPVWDGANWVLTPSDITVSGNGNIGDGTGETSNLQNILLLATDLPAGGQTALQQLYSFIEGEMAAVLG